MKYRVGVVCALVCGGLGLAGCGPRHINLVAHPNPEGIQVSGHGEAKGAPDVARVTLGVEMRALRALEANDRASRQMEKILATLKQQGVAESDVRTQNYSINFEQTREPFPEPLPSEPSPPVDAPVDGSRAGGEVTKANVGTSAGPNEQLEPRGFYRVSNTVEVTVRQLDNLGKVLGAATGAGANNIWGIQFEIEDPSPLEARARELAMAEARARAEQLAALGGVKLGRLVSVSASGGGGPIGRESGFGYSLKAADQANVPVERGELTVTQDLSVVYAIEQ